MLGLEVKAGTVWKQGHYGWVYMRQGRSFVAVNVTGEILHYVKGRHGGYAMLFDAGLGTGLQYCGRLTAAEFRRDVLAAIVVKGRN